jgi:hypothetical protein
MLFASLSLGAMGVIFLTAMASAFVVLHKAGVIRILFKGVWVMFRLFLFKR